MKKSTLAAGLLALSSAAMAGPAAYVHTPTVEYGETEIELHLGTTREPGEERETAAVLAFARGLTQHWYSEVEFEFEREGSQGTRLEAFEWANILTFAEQGEWPVDLGLLLVLERPMDHAEGWEVKVGALLQKDFGKVQLNFNPILERHLDAEEESETELVYEWQAKYRYAQAFEFGMQGFGEVGKWNDWEDSDEQTHMAGPAIFGKWPIGEHDAIKYDMALLYGLNDHTADHTLRMTVEYEF
ncbi:MAG: hypothetical protein KDG55_08560 [Rhodocyclaceae bacterium]|nr:hypothetical protein [Rhodocyclaceae bacterium]